MYFLGLLLHNPWTSCYQLMFQHQDVMLALLFFSICDCRFFDIPQKTSAQPHRFQWGNSLLVYVSNLQVCAFFALDQQLCVKPTVLNWICPISAYSCASSLLLSLSARGGSTKDSKGWRPKLVIRSGLQHQQLRVSPRDQVQWQEEVQAGGIIIITWFRCSEGDLATKATPGT
jgi:hypothetical protein